MNRLDEGQLLKSHVEVVTAASQLATGQIGFIDGIRKIAGLRTSVCSLDHDPDFMLFVGIDSESDHLPGRQQRELCSPEWLDQCDREARELESHWIGLVRPACHVLIKRFSTS